MNYEQKYNEALERAKKLSIDGHLDAIAIDEIFPELAESEDEKIRKAIISILKGEIRYISIEDTNKYVAWLEKQKEKSAEPEWCHHSEVAKISDQELEPKFHPGDWVIDNFGDTYQIESAAEIIAEHIFGYTIVGGGYFNDNSNVRLWSINDAKDGDVLVSGRTIVVVKHKYNNTSTFDSACAYIGEDDSFISCTQYCYCADCGSWHPATKEQRKLLFSKMKDAGYEWDADKKELRKIDTYQLSENPCSN